MECMCPILGKVTQAQPIRYSTGPWQLMKCQETGFIFLLDPPSYAAVADEFAWQKTFVEEKQKRLTSEPVLSRVSNLFKLWRTSTFRKRDKLFSLARRGIGTEKTLAVLDIGSGRGHRMAKLCRNFEQRGISVVPSGIEISPELAAVSNSLFTPFGGSVVTDTAYDGITRFPPDTFDIVVMSCYLEHESRPLEVLRRTHTIMKEDGIIIVKVPNYDSVNRLWRGHRWCGFRFPDHVNYFTPATLRIVAEQAGYELQPQRLSDRPPTSDNMYAVLRKRTDAAALRRAA